MTGQSRRLLAGFAEADFTPAPGLSLFGQMHERISERVRDPLMASAAAFAQEGDPPAVLVSVDVCVLDAAFVAAAQEEFAGVTGVPARRLLIHATHTHVAPATMTIMAGSADPAFVARLRHAIVQAARQAVDRLAPATVYGGTGRLDHLGWNRRGMFADGTSRMYGGAGTPGFVGSEGPRDPALPVLFARDPSGAVRGVVLGFSTHPNCLEGECFYSADLPGEARRLLKAMLDHPVVVYLTGPAGNTAPSILDRPIAAQPWRGEEGLLRSGLYLAGEAAKTMAACTTPMEAPAVRLEQTEVPIGLRPWPRDDQPWYPLPLRSDEWAGARAYYEGAQRDWPRLRSCGPEPVRLNVLRVGDAVVCTNPAELFVEHGLRMRRRSPARVTLLAELTDGYVGYVPTLRAFRRGGYETWPAATSRLAADAGRRIVDGTVHLLARAFAGSPGPD